MDFTNGYVIFDIGKLLSTLTTPSITISPFIFVLSSRNSILGLIWYNNVPGKTLFISLREDFELPLNNSTYSSALNNWVINKTPIHEIEKEVLKIELDKSLPISSQSHKPKSKI